MSSGEATHLLDEAASWLERYHEAIQQGSNLDIPGEFDENLSSDLRQAMRGIRAIQLVWPRSESGTVPGQETGPFRQSSTDGSRPISFEPSTRLEESSLEERDRKPDIPGFEILNRIGRGGMGVVYRARQLSLHREVALKVLPPALADDPERLARFRTEATLAASLLDSRILPIYDVVERDNVPMLIMPYVPGSDLAKVIHRQELAERSEKAGASSGTRSVVDREYLTKMLPLLDQLIDAVAVVHRANIIHRDIKPSNVLVDEAGNLWLSDFGLARLGEKSHLTASGMGVGTVGFMSPEQWVGSRDIDGRADVFSLGATIYQALTLQLPYGKERLTEQSSLALPPSKHRQSLSRDFDAVILKALEPDLKRRYGSVIELRADWRRVRQGQPPLARRIGRVERARRFVAQHRWSVGAGCVIAVLLILVAFMAANSGGPDAGSAKAEVRNLRRLQIVTDPPGADVVLIPVDENGEFLAERKLYPEGGQKTPCVVAGASPGVWLVQVEVPGYGFHEVYRTVPASDADRGVYRHQRWSRIEDDVIQLHQVKIPESAVVKDMVRFEGGDFVMGPDVAPQETASKAHHRTVAAFYLDKTETTIEMYEKCGLKIPARMSEAAESARADFKQHPIAFVNYHQALACAEIMGKRLPTEAEYEFAATAAGQRSYPWGNDGSIIKDWKYHAVGDGGFDRTNTKVPVVGLYSNVAEWIDTVPLPYEARNDPEILKSLASPFAAKLRQARVVRGAPPSVTAGSSLGREDDAVHGPRWLTARWREFRDREHSSAMIGFRCARSDKPRFR